MAARQSERQARRGGLIPFGKGAGTTAPAWPGHLSNAVVKSDRPHTTASVSCATGLARTTGGAEAHARGSAATTTVATKHRFPSSTQSPIRALRTHANHALCATACDRSASS